MLNILDSSFLFIIGDLVMGGKGTVMQKIRLENAENQKRLQRELQIRRNLKKVNATSNNYQHNANEITSTPN